MQCCVILMMAMILMLLGIGVDHVYHLSQPSGAGARTRRVQAMQKSPTLRNTKKVQLTRIAKVQEECKQ